MNALDALNHLANFVLPALLLGGLASAGAKLLWRRSLQGVAIARLAAWSAARRCSPCWPDCCWTAATAPCPPTPRWCWTAPPGWPGPAGGGAEMKAGRPPAGAAPRRRAGPAGRRRTHGYAVKEVFCTAGRGSPRPPPGLGCCFIGTELAAASSTRWGGTVGSDLSTASHSANWFVFETIICSDGEGLTASTGPRPGCSSTTGSARTVADGHRAHQLPLRRRLSQRGNPPRSTRSSPASRSAEMPAILLGVTYMSKLGPAGDPPTTGLPTKDWPIS